jgi:hypothetical protein
MFQDSIREHEEGIGVTLPDTSTSAASAARETQAAKELMKRGFMFIH